MKVLIISTNAIGDAYLSMAAIEPIKKKYPDAEFYFIFPEHARLLHSNIDENFTFVFLKKNYSSLLKALFMLFPIQFDRVYSFFPGMFNSTLFSLLRGKIKAGQINFVRENRWDDKNATLLFQWGKWKRKRVIHNKYDNYLSRISTVLRSTDGINENVKKYQPFPDAGNSITTNRVLIHYNSSVLEKSLSLNLLTELIRFIEENTYLDIVLVGTSTDFTSEKRRGFAEYSVDYLIDPDLETLIETIKTSFFIGVDSFPLHIADAYNTNFLALFSITNPKSALVSYKKSLIFDEGSFRRISSKDFLTQLNNYLIKNTSVNLVGERNEARTKENTVESIRS